MLKKIGLLCWLLLGSKIALAQTAQQYIRAAEKAVAAKQYISAVGYYREALQGDSTDAALLYAYADALRLANASSKANYYYNKIQRADRPRFALLNLHQAWVLQKLDSCDRVSLLLKDFIQKTTDAALLQQAENTIESCFDTRLKSTDIFPAKVTRIAQPEVNTEFSDFGAIRLKDALLYSSLRLPFKEKNGTQTYRSGLFLLSGEQKTDFMPNTAAAKELSYANPALSTDGNRLYFSQCNWDKANQDWVCELYYFNRRDDDVWLKKPMKLPKTINAEGATTTHPMLAYDSLCRCEVLYFVSNRVGGLGGMDIWAAQYKEDMWQKPQNLGDKINTAGNEATPFFYAKKNLFYFSSDGRKGLGGYDIYAATRQKNGQYSEPLHTGIPLNSPYNDLYLYLQNDSTGLMSSNRQESLTLNNDGVCCNDIYTVDFLRKKIKQPPLPKDTIPKVVEIPQKPPPPIQDTVKSTPKPPVSPPLPPVYFANFRTISLYYHNDEPNPKTRLTQTQYAYDQTYQQYILLKNNYKQRYSMGFVGLQKADLEQAIASFFEDKVVENYTRLEGFTNELAQVLATGKTVVVHLRGYCSPRTTTDYNAKLAERRISCVKNYFLGWQNKALQSYIQSGKLRFSELPLGETTAPKGINDDIKNERLSIFSPEAAAERRVEIERVTVEASR